MNPMRNPVSHQSLTLTWTLIITIILADRVLRGEAALPARAADGSLWGELRSGSVPQHLRHLQPRRRSHLPRCRAITHHADPPAQLHRTPLQPCFMVSLGHDQPPAYASSDDNVQLQLALAKCMSLSRFAMGAEEDASELAKQALQLVWRIGVRATVAYVVDVFRGSKNAAICRAGHDRVQGAGAGSHLA